MGFYGNVVSVFVVHCTRTRIVTISYVDKTLTICTPERHNFQGNLQSEKANEHTTSTYASLLLIPAAVGIDS